jgi:probable dihydroxyacetone kinase regulator
MVRKSFAKISISDLCEECGLNRKSFYYHFKDKYDLVNWIFYVDFLTNMGGKNFENEWDVLVAVCNIFYQNKAFYQSALRIEGQNSFKDYFYEMLEPVMAFFVQDLFQVQNQKLFVTFFCDAFLTAVLRWFSMESELEPETFVEELKEVICRSSEKIAAKAEPKRNFISLVPLWLLFFLMIYISLLSVLRQTFPVPARFPWKTSAEPRSGRHHRRTLQTVSDSVPERDPVQKTP